MREKDTEIRENTAREHRQCFFIFKIILSVIILVQVEKTIG